MALDRALFALAGYQNRYPNHNGLCIFHLYKQLRVDLYNYSRIDREERMVTRRHQIRWFVSSRGRDWNLLGVVDGVCRVGLGEREAGRLAVGVVVGAVI